MAKSLLNLIKARKSTLQFSDRSVSDNDLQKILEAGRWAPSPLNVQPWNFILVRDRKRISSMMKTSFYGYPHSDPSAIIAIVVLRQYWNEEFMRGAGHGRLGLLECHMSSAMAGMNMIYAAQSLGIDSCIITPDMGKVPPILGLNARDFVPLFIGFGYGKKREKGKRVRKPLADIVSYETLSNRSKPK